MKADLKGLAFKLMKGRHKNYIELEYNFEQCYLALSDQLDWVNPESDRITHDLSKPLALHDAPGRLTIPVYFFFNKYLEYLTNGNAEKKYATSLTKPKAARYDLEGIVQMIPKLWGSFKILSIVRLSIDKQFGYGYLKEIVVRRANQKEYTFKEADFLRLHLNDIEDMYLFYQTKLNLTMAQYSMRDDELNKFGDGTLKKADSLHTGEDLEDVVNKTNYEEFEVFVGGGQIDTDYRLLTRTKGLCHSRKLLEDIHVTWAHLEKKQTRLQLYTKVDEEIAQILWRRRLKYWRRRQNLQATASRFL
ncbi:hypothetical protein Tco_1058412 [Tanacetum coccineum]|uniref:Uncharacterized protein n=1 Tax=Tanacetum coccineum TaxID=301880 RepID=A0ABQ5H8T8_9ASTR